MNTGNPIIDALMEFYPRHCPHCEGELELQATKEDVRKWLALVEYRTRVCNLRFAGKNLADIIDILKEESKGVKMKAIVQSIQVGGGKVVNSLQEAVAEYARMLQDEEFPALEKLHFAIELPSGEIKHITIRDEDSGTVAYGDFVGLPNSLEYARDVRGENV